MAQPHCRIVAPRCLSAQSISGTALLSVDQFNVEITPFKCETEATISLSWPIAVLKQSVVDEFLLDDIDRILQFGLNSTTLNKLDEYFRASGLYYDTTIPASAASDNIHAANRPFLLQLTITGARPFNLPLE